jgi:hypothetical protein
MVASMQIRAFWNTVSCSLAEVNQNFRPHTASFNEGKELTALKIETVHISETLVYFYETTQSHISKGSIFRLITQWFLK